MSLRFGFRPQTWLLLFAVSVLAGSPCLGAKPYQPVYGDPMLEPWRWRAFPELNGLDAQCMTEGADGKLWFGTAEGLWSYDGYEWIRHSTNEIPGAGISIICSQTLCSESDGSLYVGGVWGISRFSDVETNWTELMPPVKQHFANVRKLALARDGSLWAATAWGALHRQKTAWTLYTDSVMARQLRDDPVSRYFDIKLLPETVVARARPRGLSTNRYDLVDICPDQAGRVWFGTRGGEILCFTPAGLRKSSDAATGTADGLWSLYDEADGVDCGPLPCLLTLTDGTVWMAHASASQASVFDGNNWQTIPLPSPGLVQDGCKMIQTRDGAVWVSARYCLYAYRNGQWRTYGKPELPIPTALNLIVQTADGALWIAGPNLEIQRVDYQTARWLTYRDLNFQWQSHSGAQWFLSRDGRVVLHETNRWTSYGAEDGLMDSPVALLGTSKGDIWVAGSHEHLAAMARFDGRSWTRFVHDDFSWGVDWRGLFESSDGSLWFAAAVDSSGPKKHYDGLLQLRDGAWIHHRQPGRAPENSVARPATVLPPGHRPEPIEKYYSLGESPDGKIWAGRNVLVFHDGRQWQEFFPTSAIRIGIIESMLTTSDRDLWVGTRQNGALRYDGRTWQEFQGRDSLMANTVLSLAQTADGSIWAATDRGFSRFDGRTWMADALPAPMIVPYEGGNLKASPDGGLWVNRFPPEWMRRAWPKEPPADPNAEFWTICHQFHGLPPRTTITAGPTQIAQPGNVSVLWAGTMPLREPKDARLQFAYRLDGQPWSAYTSEGGHAFFTLPGGPHHLEVRARDQDFNVDPTPAALDFVVLPPVWRQAWFLWLMMLLTGLIVTQSVRLILERNSLRQTNRLLAAEVKERARAEASLNRLNQELDQRVKERTAELELANKELESFGYSVSHDLRAPLRSIDGFSRALLEDYGDKLDADGRENLQIVRKASQRMGVLIDDMLRLSRITRDEMRWTDVNLSRLASQVAEELKSSAPERQVEFVIAPDCVVRGDPGLLRIVLENGLGNAWKYTAKRRAAKIEFGSVASPWGPAWFIRDDGCGFEMKYADRLFGAFQRLHDAKDFPGTGIGLASVQRVIHRHGGRVWIEGKVGQGATLYFSLPENPPARA